MIATSRSLKIVAVVLAAGAHLGASGALAPEMVIEMESSAGAAEARLGASFADMSAGTLTPAETTEETEAMQPEPVQSPTPDTELTPEKPATTAKPIPELTPPADPTALAVLAPQTTEALQPKRQESTAAKPVQEVIEAAPDDPGLSSPRPKRRDPELAAKVAPPKPKAPVKTAKKQPAKKNAPKATQEAGKVNNRQGSSTGSQNAKAKAQGTKGGQAKSSGNAAASNYPGKVMRRIARVRKPNVRARGVTVVAFAISSSGGLSSLSVARSSGSAALDKAALGVIRKASPFPAPPKGARRSFSIKIKGK